MPERLKAFRKYKSFIVLALLLASVFAEAQLSVGNQTNAKNTPGWNNNYTLTWDHNHNTGDDGVLVVILHSATNNTVSGVKYNNVSMTQRSYYNDGNAKVGIYELANPATGTNEIKVTVSSHGNAVAAVAQSFTGATTGGEVDRTADTPNNSNVHTATRSSLTVGSRMIVVGTSAGRSGSPAYDVEGSSYTPTKRDGDKKMGVAI